MANRVLRRLMVVACTAAIASSEAQILDNLNIFKGWSTKNRVETLIVTGNYAKSRLLAELVQHRTKQPIILFTPAAGGGHDVYFLPAKPEATALPASRFVEFVIFLRPQRVVFLGDERYVPADFVRLIQDRFPTVIINSTDWIRNSAAMAAIFNYKNLISQYAGYLQQMYEPVHDFGPTAGEAAAFGGPAEPHFAPRTVIPVRPTF